MLPRSISFHRKLEKHSHCESTTIQDWIIWYVNRTYRTKDQLKPSDIIIIVESCTSTFIFFTGHNIQDVEAQLGNDRPVLFGGVFGKRSKQAAEKEQ